MPGLPRHVVGAPADGLGAVALANATSGPDIGAIAADLVTIVADSEPRVPERWKPLAEVEPGPARADRPVVLGASALSVRWSPAAAWSSRRRRPGPRLPVPRRARRHLDRPRRLLHRRDAAPGARGRRHGRPHGPGTFIFTREPTAGIAAGRAAGPRGLAGVLARSAATCRESPETPLRGVPGGFCGVPPPSRVIHWTVPSESCSTFQRGAV